MEKHFKKVAFSVYPVTDMVKARKFYEGTLGLRAGEDFDGKWQEYDLGGTCFAISNMISEWVKPGTQSAVSFEVSDLKAVVTELRKKDVRFTMDEIMDTPVCQMQFVLDPDGNTIGLHQCK